MKTMFYKNITALFMKVRNILIMHEATFHTKIHEQLGILSFINHDNFYLSFTLIGVEIPSVICNICNIANKSERSFPKCLNFARTSIAFKLFLNLLCKMNFSQFSCSI